ncbi:hypothetical protein FD755_010028 [Muntiacus reevesi]|uniref:Uncharacterized protein n=1 Tax=Muntiacus reevesi TaxID=9886 RepID=A0A5N3XWZ3_MUNRE|nr:hypothetical protein FD755_010028 [Muntiacus reevesi]
MPKGGTKPSPLQKSKDSSGIDTGDPQSTVLEGHSTAAVVRNPDLSKAMGMMESQMLLLTPLTVKIENGLSTFEEQAEKNLQITCKEMEKLQEQMKKELADALDARIAMLSPFEAAASRLPAQYKTCPAALGTLRHALPMQSSQRERTTTRRLLESFSIGSSEENAKALDLMRELRESFGQVLKLSAEARKEAALGHQEAWEEAQGPKQATGGEAWGEVRSLSGHEEL